MSSVTSQCKSVTGCEAVARDTYH